MIQNKSVIPSVFTTLTQNLLLSFQFTADDIENIMKKFNPNNADGHDIIRISIITFSSDSIYKSIEMISKSCLNQGIFPAELKKAM